MDRTDMKQIHMENSSHTKGSILGSGLIFVIHLSSTAIIKKTFVCVCERERERVRVYVNESVCVCF
jgi:hypothetical protein